MDTQPPVGGKAFASIPSLLASQKRSDRLQFIVIFVTVLCLAPLLAAGGMTIGFSLVLGVLAALLVACVVVCWPVTGFYILALCVVLVEQEPLMTPVGTDQLYVYYWPRQLEGMLDRPIGFVCVLVVLIFACHQFMKRRRVLRGGPLLIPFLLFMLSIAGGVAYGLMTGGDFKIVILEVRPFWYIFLSYLLAYNLVSRKAHIRGLFWIVILGAGVKALQGDYIYLFFLKGNLEGHREIMAHEESFFFVALLLLVVLFCLHYHYRAQLIAALCVIPFLLIALIANQRRADYIALLVGLLVGWALIFVLRPRARVWLALGLLFCGLLGGAYVAAFYNGSGSVSEPARAVVSIFYPDPKDASSNYYRDIENFDLKYTVRQYPLIGYGFGKPFLQPTPLPNILADDPYYLYVPHNTIYWVWMRLGAIGFVIFWYLVGSVIVRGCMIARRLRDPYLQMFAVYVVAVVFMEIVVAFADYQLFFYRNVLYFGLLIGCLLKLPELDKEAGAGSSGTQKGVVTVDEVSRDLAELATSNVGSRHA